MRDHGRPLVNDPARTAGVVAVGVDETAFLAASAGSHTQFVTGIVAMPGPGRERAQLLDVVPGRSGSVVQQWITAQDPAWRAQVTTASLDPFRGCARCGTTLSSETGAQVASVKGDRAWVSSRMAARDVCKEKRDRTRRRQALEVEMRLVPGCSDEDCWEEGMCAICTDLQPRRPREEQEDYLARLGRGLAASEDWPQGEG